MALLWCVREGRPPLLYIAMRMSVWRRFPCMPTCNRHGGATRRCHMKGGGGWRPWGCRHTLGASAPRCGRLATAFRMVVCSWARSVAMPVLVPDWMGRWATLLICLFCAFLVVHFDSISMCFIYMPCKTMILQYMWK